MVKRRPPCHECVHLDGCALGFSVDHCTLDNYEGGSRSAIEYVVCF
jgi:hypothetical protein